MQYSGREESVCTPKVEPLYTLESISDHAGNIRDNMYDINSGLYRILGHLRGEHPSACGDTKAEAVDGKLAEISVAQQHTRNSQGDTYRLIAELQSLLNVNA